MAKTKQKHVYLISGWTNNFDDLRKLRPYYGDPGKGPLKAEWIDYASILKKTKEEYDDEHYIYFRKNVKGRLGPFTFKNGKIQPKSPCKIIVTDKEVIKSSAYFNEFILYHLGLIPMTKKNQKIIALAAMNMNSYRDYKLDNVSVFPGRFEGIDGAGLFDGSNLNYNEIIHLKTNLELRISLDDKERHLREKWALNKPAEKVLEGRVDSPFNYLRGLGNHPPNYLAGVPGHCKILSGEKALNALVRKGYEPLIDFFKKAVKTYEGRKI